jgi:hypothetical protein
MVQTPSGPAAAVAGIARAMTIPIVVSFCMIASFLSLADISAKQAGSRLQPSSGLVAGIRELSSVRSGSSWAHATTRQTIDSSIS